MMQTVRFVILNVILPLILSCYYSWNVQKKQLQYDLTKGAFYCIYGILVCIDYCVKGHLSDLQNTIVGLPIMLAMMEGIPLLLKPLFCCIKHNKK